MEISAVVFAKRQVSPVAEAVKLRRDDAVDGFVRFADVVVAVLRAAAIVVVVGAVFTTTIIITTTATTTARLDRFQHGFPFHLSD